MSHDMRRGVLSFLERLALVWEGFALLLHDLWVASQPVRAALAAQADRTRHWPVSWGFFYGAVLCLAGFWGLDRPLALVLKAHVTGDLEGFFKIITRLGEAVYYLVPSGIAALILFGTSMRRLPLDMIASVRRQGWKCLYVFAAIATSGLMGIAAKYALGRLRPRYFFEDGRYELTFFSQEWGMNSFPSGHSQAAFAAMTALWVLFPRHVALWFSVALLVAVSRVATTVHWFSDAVAGSWLGWAVALLLARWMIRRGWLVVTPR